MSWLVGLTLDHLYFAAIGGYEHQLRGDREKKKSELDRNLPVDRMDTYQFVTKEPHEEANYVLRRRRRGHH